MEIFEVDNETFLHRAREGMIMIKKYNDRCVVGRLFYIDYLGTGSSAEVVLKDDIDQATRQIISSKMTPIHSSFPRTGVMWLFNKHDTDSVFLVTE